MLCICTVLMDHRLVHIYLVDFRFYNELKRGINRTDGGGLNDVARLKRLC